MANFDPNLFTPTLVRNPEVQSGKGPRTGMLAGAAVGPQHGVVGVVIVAALALILLDKAGFRFMVTTGKR